METIYDTDNYCVRLDKEDKEGLWYHIVNKEYDLVESKESLKPQALVYCEQFNLLLKQESHKTIADNMVKGMAEEALMGYTMDPEFH